VLYIVTQENVLIWTETCCNLSLYYCQYCVVIKSFVISTVTKVQTWNGELQTMEKGKAELSVNLMEWSVNLLEWSVDLLESSLNICIFYLIQIYITGNWR
jgi:hypothetical protein